MRIERIQIDITIVEVGGIQTIDIAERREVLEIIPLPPPPTFDEMLNALLEGKAPPITDPVTGEVVGWQIPIPNPEQVLGRLNRKVEPKVEPLKLHNPNTLVKFVRHPDTGKALGCVVGVQDWDGSTKVGWSQLNPVDDTGKFDKHEAIGRAIDRAWSGAGAKSPSTVKVDNTYGGPSRVDLFLPEILTMKQRAERYFWKPVEEVVASCYDCGIE